MFGIVIGLPWLIWLGRRARQVACAGFVFLMILISLTGNYCFFNLMTVAMCLLQLDDRALRWPSRSRLETAPTRPASRWRNWIFAPVAAAMLVASVPLVFRSC